MEKLKSNKGISMADVVIALLILIILSGVIGNILYQIAYNNAELRMNAIATDYAVKVAEYIDKIPYENVTNGMQITEINGEQIIDKFNVSIEVENYNNDDSTKEDIIKKAIITVNYSILKETKNYKIQKLKIKEM